MTKFQDGWDRRPNGNIYAHPMTGFQISEQGLTVAVRLEWTEPQPGGYRRAKSVQLHLPPEAAMDIANNLARVAPQHGPKPKGSA